MEEKNMDSTAENSQEQSISAASAIPATRKHGKVFQCVGFPGCNMVFTRSEHLARHIRKHTGERPFQCNYCLKKFSRMDNLRQHKQTVHQSEHESCKKKRVSSDGINENDYAERNGEHKQKKIKPQEQIIHQNYKPNFHYHPIAQQQHINHLHQLQPTQMEIPPETPLTDIKQEYIQNTPPSSVSPHFRIFNNVNSTNVLSPLNFHHQFSPQIQNQYHQQQQQGGYQAYQNHVNSSGVAQTNSQSATRSSDSTIGTYESEKNSKSNYSNKTDSAFNPDKPNCTITNPAVVLSNFTGPKGSSDFINNNSNSNGLPIYHSLPKSEMSTIFSPINLQYPMHTQLSQHNNVPNMTYGMNLAYGDMNNGHSNLNNVGLPPIINASTPTHLNFNNATSMISHPGIQQINQIPSIHLQSLSPGQHTNPYNLYPPLISPIPPVPLSAKSNTSNHSANNNSNNSLPAFSSTNETEKTGPFAQTVKIEQHNSMLPPPRRATLFQPRGYSDSHSQPVALVIQPQPANTDKTPVTGLGQIGRPEPLSVETIHDPSFTGSDVHVPNAATTETTHNLPALSLPGQTHTIPPDIISINDTTTLSKDTQTVPIATSSAGLLPQEEPSPTERRKEVLEGQINHLFPVSPSLKKNWLNSMLNKSG